MFDCCQRPYHVVNTGSRLITAVKQRWAWLVLGWVTAWEYHVLLALILNFFSYNDFYPRWHLEKLRNKIYPKVILSKFFLNYVIYAEVRNCNKIIK